MGCPFLQTFRAKMDISDLNRCCFSPSRQFCKVSKVNRNSSQATFQTFTFAFFQTFTFAFMPTCIQDRTHPHPCSRLRILAAGGDGTVAWLLKTIKELQLQPPPLVAVMPLGTGNDLSLSFGWGNTFLQAWIQAGFLRCKSICCEPNNFPQ